LKVSFLGNRIVYLKRHAQHSFKALTVRKIANAVLNEYEFRRKKIVLKSKPYFIKIEPTAFCHLKCPDCYHGSDEKLDKKLNAIPPLPFDVFKKIIDSIEEYIIGISLTIRGESMWNPDLLNMVEYAHSRNIATVFPSNLSMRLDQETIERIVTSGLDLLMVALDGTTQEAYSQYRQGGSLELVLRNSQSIIDAKRKFGSKTPLLEWKFIIFDHNKDQLEQARQMAKQMGFDRFEPVMNVHGETYKNITKPAAIRNIARRKACYWPWNNAVIFADGTVGGCCNDKLVMGNINHEDFETIWNNKSYQNLRRFFLEPEKFPPTYPCAGCMNF